MEVFYTLLIICQGKKKSKIKKDLVWFLYQIRGNTLMALAFSFDSHNFMLLRLTFAFWNSNLSFFIQSFRHLLKAIHVFEVSKIPTRPANVISYEIQTEV